MANREQVVARQKALVEFAVIAEAGSKGANWVALTVEDSESLMAFPNPIWVKPLAEADVLPQE